MLESRTLYSNFWCGMTSQVQAKVVYNNDIHFQEISVVYNQFLWSITHH